MPFYDSDATPTVIIHIDVDCFEVQLWQKLFPQPLGSPCLTANESGMITSVNYEAKWRGVRRGGMTLTSAKRICPELRTIMIPNRFGKPDTRKPREASYKLYDALKEVCDTLKCVIRYESKDEFFIDVTPEVKRRMRAGQRVPTYQEVKNLPEKTFLLNHRYKLFKKQEQFSFRVHQVLGKATERADHQLEAGLIHGAVLANTMIEALRAKTGFECSAGVGHNKLTAKLACGLYKPAAITIMPIHGITRASKVTRIPDVPGLGGVKGEAIMNYFEIETMYDLSLVPIEKLAKVRISKNLPPIGITGAAMIHGHSVGVDDIAVEEKTMNNKISCGKSFKGKKIITSQGDLMEHLFRLCAEVMERMEEEKDRHNRTAVSYKLEIEGWPSSGRGGRGRNVRFVSLFGDTVNVTSMDLSDAKSLFDIFKGRFLNSDRLKSVEADFSNISNLNIVATFTQVT